MSASVSWYGSTFFQVPSLWKYEAGLIKKPGVQVREGIFPGALYEH